MRPVKKKKKRDKDYVHFIIPFLFPLSIFILHYFGCLMETHLSSPPFFLEKEYSRSGTRGAQNGNVFLLVWPVVVI